VARRSSPPPTMGVATLRDRFPRCVSFLYLSAGPHTPNFSFFHDSSGPGTEPTFMRQCSPGSWIFWPPPCADPGPSSQFLAGSPNEVPELAGSPTLSTYLKGNFNLAFISMDWALSNPVGGLPKCLSGLFGSSLVKRPVWTFSFAGFVTFYFG